MRTLVLSLLAIVVLPAGRHAMAADGATSLIEAVSRAAGDAVSWEASGRLVTQESADGPALQSDATFRIVIERVPTQRARIEITDVPAPLVRVCDGSVQWGYQPAAKQFWTVNYARIDACTEPFNEWPHLVADLHDPAIVGQDQLHIGDRVIDCIVVSGDYVEPEASRSGKRTLWIDAGTKTISQYRVERGTTGLARQAEPAVRIYTLLRQTHDSASQPGDFALQAPLGSEKLERAPALRLGDGAPLHVTAPVVIFKAAPEYTHEARRSRIEGTVVLFVEVGPDGTAHNIKIIHSLDPGLDEKAIEAVRKWKFLPGEKEGVPVSVAAQIQVNFQFVEHLKRQ